MWLRYLIFYASKDVACKNYNSNFRFYDHSFVLSAFHGPHSLPNLLQPPFTYIDFSVLVLRTNHYFLHIKRGIFFFKDDSPPPQDLLADEGFMATPFFKKWVGLVLSRC